MKKHYLIFLFFIFAFFTTYSGFSQNTATATTMQQNIEDLAIYPNPVNNGVTFIYITSKLNLTKKIELYDILGKRILNTVLVGKELNISSLNKGVYILKITEKNISETSKLVIK